MCVYGFFSTLRCLLIFSQDFEERPTPDSWGNLNSHTVQFMPFSWSLVLSTFCLEESYLNIIFAVE